MNYSEHLQDFLDGSLDSAGEQSLFSELATNSTLRAEMKDWLAMKSAVWSDYRAFAPPVDATSSVFAALNFSAPLSAGVGAIGAGVATKAGWWSSLTSGLGASTMGALLTKSAMPFLLGWLVSLAMSSTIFALWGNDFHILLHGGMRTVPAQSFVPPSSSWQSSADRYAPHGSQSYPMIIHDTLRVASSDNAAVRSYALPSYGSSTQTLLASSVGYARAAEAYRSFIIDSESGESHLATTDRTPKDHYDELSDRITRTLQSVRQTSETFATKSDIPHTPVTQPSDMQSPQAPTPVVPIQTDDKQTMSQPKENDDQFSIDLRGISSQSLVTPTIGTGTQPFLTNGAIGIRAKVSCGGEVGIEAGREAYFQSFTIRNSDNELFRVEQQPVLTWAGIAYRHSFMPDATLSPFVHSVLGVTEIGPMARGMAGIIFRPDARVSFILGAESSISAFRINGAWYTSPKIGLSYGVSISF